jgi:hypothetical protein
MNHYFSFTSLEPKRTCYVAKSAFKPPICHSSCGKREPIAQGEMKGGGGRDSRKIKNALAQKKKEKTP